MRYVFREIFVDQVYDFSSDSRSPFIVDCGSNIGLSVLYFKLRYPDAEILAFEPEPHAFAALRENITSNRLGNVCAEPLAVCGVDGSVTMHVDPNEPASLLAGLSPPCLAGTTREVEATRLSNHIHRTVDFLKIDVEGAEWAIIEDLAQSGKLAHVRQLAIEYHHSLTTRKSCLSPSLRVLEEAGFQYLIDSPSVRPPRRVPFQNIMIYAFRGAEVDGQLSASARSRSRHSRQRLGR